MADNFIKTKTFRTKIETNDTPSADPYISLLSEERHAFWKNNGGVQDQIESANLQINVASTGREDRYLFDVYVSLETTPNLRSLIEITQRLTISSFIGSVREALESKYPNLNGLKGLRIKEMKIFPDTLLYSINEE